MNLRAHSPWWRRAARRLGARLFQFAENNEDARFAHNGELWFLRQVLDVHAKRGDSRPLVVFDAGANQGAYTEVLLAEARRTGCAVDVHAFEPSPVNLTALQRRFGAGSPVRVVGAALSDRAGEAELFAGRDGSSHASLAPRSMFGAAAAESVRVPLMRLDTYLDTQGVGHVDLLKLDVEGFELAALRGLGERLRPETIDVIQFEYGGTTADAGASLHAINALLTERGFLLGKIFPSALELREFRPWMENYAYANYVAVSPGWRSVATS
jgi:FkbM family methyltransferase